MKKQLLCGAAVGALAVMTSSASFAAPPPPIFNWSGFYVGGHVGYGAAEFKGVFNGNSNQSLFIQRPDGILGGVQFGQLWQMNTFVYGWEADASWMNFHSSQNLSTSSPEPDFLANKLSMLASLRARLGMSFDGFIFQRALLYVTGGAAYARAKFIMFDSDIPGTLTTSYGKFGGVVGIGGEWAVANNWTWRVEGLYYIFNGINKTLGPDPNGSGDFATGRLENIAVIRIGLNYKFGAP
jgi:outer membrane immunogenic protein